MVWRTVPQLTTSYKLDNIVVWCRPTVFQLLSCAALPPTCYTIEVGRQCCTVHCLPTCCTIKVGHQCYLAHCPPTCYISLIGRQCCLVHRPPTYHVIKVGRHSCYALSPNLIITSSSWATLLLWLRYDTIRYEMLF